MSPLTLTPTKTEGGNPPDRSTTETYLQMSLLREEPMTTAMTMSNEIPAPQWCQRCLERPNDPCPSCAARRRKVARLYNKGWDPTDIAENMKLSRLKVLRLIEQEMDRLELQQYERERSTIDNTKIRELVRKWQMQDQRNTIAELARLADFDCPTHVKRMLGLKATSPTNKDDRHYPSRVRTTIAIDNAERLLRAMGYAPVDLEWILT